MTLAQLNTCLDEIQQKVDWRIDPSVPSLIMEKIAELTNLLGLSGECCAWAERFYNEKLGELVLDKNYKNLTATDKKMLFASLASKEIQLYTWAERLNKGISHSLDGLRSLISFLKEDYKQTHGG